MSELNLILTVIPIYIGIAVVIFLAGWPGRPPAIRLLQRWGVDDPTDVEIAEARRYLRRHQFAYPLFYLAYSIGILQILPEPPPILALILAVMLTGGLFAELGTLRRNGRDLAPPGRDPYSVRALIPAWAFSLAAALFGAFALLTGAALGGQAWAVGVVPDPVPTLACGCAVALFSAASIWLAVRRPARCAVRADGALRLCTVRNSLATGMLAVSGLVALGDSLGGYVVAALGFVAAVATTSFRKRRLEAGDARCSKSTSVVALPSGSLDPRGHRRAGGSGERGAE